VGQDAPNYIKIGQVVAEITIFPFLKMAVVAILDFQISLISIFKFR